MSFPWRRAGLVLWMVALVWAALLLGFAWRQAEAPEPEVLTPQQVANGFAASTVAPVRLPPAGIPLDGAPAPAIRLRGVGGPGTLAAYRGRVTLVAFVDAFCTGSCYGTVPVIRGALEALGARRSDVAVLAVNVAARASSAALRRWWERARFGAPGAVLSGTPGQIRAVLKAYGIVVASGRRGLTWTPALYVLDPKQRAERLFILAPNQEAMEVKAVGRAINAALSRRA